MARRLPSLNALKVLESAGRHASFTRAAEELDVTPGAVSRQIKLLEESFGMELFERKNGGLTPTHACRSYTNSLSEVFNRIEQLTKHLLNVNRENELHVSSSMTFTLRWLVPRIPAFHMRHPQWELRLTAPVLFPQLTDIEFADVFIQLSDGTGIDLKSERMFGNELVPVCSPSLLKNGAPLRKHSDLANHLLLHSVPRPDLWPHWLAATATEDVGLRSGAHFDSSTLAYQAAIDGVGVAIGQVALVLEDLRSGRLVTPFPTVLYDVNSFHLVWAGDLSSAKARAFRDWALAEAIDHDKAVQAAITGFRQVRLS